MPQTHRGKTKKQPYLELYYQDAMRESQSKLTLALIQKLVVKRLLSIRVFGKSILLFYIDF